MSVTDTLEVSAAPANVPRFIVVTIGVDGGGGDGAGRHKPQVNLQCSL